jgi:hypothetical protein
MADFPSRFPVAHIMNALGKRGLRCGLQADDGAAERCVPRQEFVEVLVRVRSNEGVTCDFEGDLVIGLVHRIGGVHRVTVL